MMKTRFFAAPRRGGRDKAKMSLARRSSELRQRVTAMKIDGCEKPNAYLRTAAATRARSGSCFRQ